MANPLPLGRQPHPNALLAVLCAAAFMTGLDVFIVNVALRPIGEGFGETSLANLSWILNGYAIVGGVWALPPRGPRSP